MSGTSEQITDLITASTNAYFIQEDFDGTFSIYFGDGVVGRKLEAGNIVSVSYLKTDGAFANGIGKNDTETNRTFSKHKLHGDHRKSCCRWGCKRKHYEHSIPNAPKSYASQNKSNHNKQFWSL